jgi:hypothetical protein
MSMMAYRASMFMVAFNFGMIIVNSLVSPLIFPDQAVSISTTGDQNGAPGISAFGFSISSIVNNLNLVNSEGIMTFLLNSAMLGMLAFSLLMPTIPIVSGFLFVSMVYTQYFLAQTPFNMIPFEILFPIRVFVLIVFLMGISQYAARQSMQGS